MDDPCIEVEAYDVQLGDVIESHDDQTHTVENWTELPSGAVILCVRKADGEVYTLYNRPTAFVRIVRHTDSYSYSEQVSA